MVLLVHLFLSFLLFYISTIAQYIDNNLFVEELYRFPDGTSLENILVLQNGSLLLTLSSEPSLYRLDPESPDPPVLVQCFPEKTSLLGIAFLNSSTVAVIGGNLTGSLYGNNPGVPGSFSVFLIALSGQVVASWPVAKASLLRGITALPDSSPGVLLLSDPTLGIIWSLDTRDGWVDNIYGSPLPGDPDFFAQSAEDVGPSINGIHYFVMFTYLTNSHKSLMGRNFCCALDGKPAGAYPTPETRPFNFTHSYYGDFAICPDFSVFIPDVLENTVTHVSIDGFSDRHDGDWHDPATYSAFLDGGVLVHPTAVAIPDLQHRCEVMYVVTAGCLPGYGGTGGGQVLKVDLTLAGEAVTPIGYQAQEPVEITETPPKTPWDDDW